MNAQQTLSEIQIQAQCFSWLWNSYPETRRCFFHVPNGGKRSPIEAAQLKASGVVAGIPDMLFVWKGNMHAFEFKDDKGRVSEAQVLVHQAWTLQGFKTEIVRSLEQFQTLIHEIL